MKCRVLKCQRLEMSTSKQCWTMYTVPKGILEGEMILFIWGNFLLCIMEMMHLLKFLNWCGKNYTNYNKYFSSNFSSMERNIFVRTKKKYSLKMKETKNVHTREEIFPHQFDKFSFMLGLRSIFCILYL